MEASFLILIAEYFVLVVTVVLYCINYHNFQIMLILLCITKPIFCFRWCKWFASIFLLQRFTKSYQIIQKKAIIYIQGQDYLMLLLSYALILKYLKLLTLFQLLTMKSKDEILLNYFYWPVTCTIFFVKPTIGLVICHVTIFYNQTPS